MSVTVCVQGEPKSGKTSLALTFPTPLVHLELDIGGFDRAAWRFREETAAGKIRSIQYALPQQAVRQALRLVQSNKVIGAKELWYKLLTDYIALLEDANVATVVIDSFPNLWSLCTRAYLQEVQDNEPSRKQLIQIEYGEPNARLRAFIQAAKEMGKNLVLVSWLDDVYQDKLVQGEVKQIVVGRDAGGWRHWKPVVDLAVETTIRTDRKGKVVTQVPVGKVVMSGLGLEVIGLEVDNPTWEQFESVVKAYRNT